MAYDESVLWRLATELQRRATAVIVWTTILVAALAAGTTFAIMSSRPSENGGGSTMIWIAAVAGALVGYLVGTERAFGLRYQAQCAFCLVQIERNTRPLPPAGYPAPAAPPPS